MIVYKLTDSAGYTRRWQIGETLWLPLGTEHTVPGEGPLCTYGWIHGYVHPLIAVLRDRADGMYLTRPGARLFRGETDDGRLLIEPLKLGTTRLRLVEEIAVPVVTVAQRVRWAIYCVQAVTASHRGTPWADAWLAWVSRWLSGKDRTPADAAAASWDAASAAAWASAAASWDAASAAAWASAAAARDATSAWAAALAAAWAAEGVRQIDFAELAVRAVREETA